MERRDMEALLERARVGRLGLCLGGEPYVVPIGFVYHGGRVYFHSSPKGRKIEAMRRNPRVCFEVDEARSFIPGPTPCSFTVEYESVIAYGRVRFLEDSEEKLEALRLLLRKYGAAEAAKVLSAEHLGDVLVGEIAVEEMTGRSRP